MSITNHALVGTAVALIVKQPVLVLPLAFLSHFVIDVFPHFGYRGQGIGETLTHKLSYVEISWSLVAFIILLSTFNYGSWIVLAGAFMAVLPDAEWAYRYFWFERKNLKPPSSPIAGFHSSLQWGERPWGIIVEVAFFVIVYVLLRRYLI